MATQAQIEANRKNSQASTGPKTPAGKAISRANSIKDGLTGEGVVLLQEQRRKVNALAEDLTARYGGPGISLYDAKLVERIALESVRSRQCQEMEDAIFLDESHNAEFNWDGAQEDAAYKLAEGLPRRPATVSRALEQTSHGCDYKVEQWESLLIVLDDTKAPWDAECRAIAFDLLGVSHPFRASSPKLGRADDPESLPKQRALAASELERLRKKKALWLDARSEFQREITIKGTAFPGKKVWRLRFLAMGCTRRFFSAMNELMKHHEGKPGPSAAKAAGLKEEEERVQPVKPREPEAPASRPRPTVVNNISVGPAKSFSTPSLATDPTPNSTSIPLRSFEFAPTAAAGNRKERLAEKKRQRQARKPS